jgi:hypothetical protein
MRPSTSRAMFSAPIADVVRSLKQERAKLVFEVWIIRVAASFGGRAECALPT